MVNGVSYYLVSELYFNYMKILIKYSPEVIRLQGDKEIEAVTNYMYNKHGIKSVSRNFAYNFLIKYNAEATLHEYKGIKFFYPKFYF